jgi:hypothetical protein
MHLDGKLLMVSMRQKMNTCSCPASTCPLSITSRHAHMAVPGALTCVPGADLREGIEKDNNSRFANALGALVILMTIFPD